MGSDCETTNANAKHSLEQVKIQTETDLKTAIAQLRKCEEVIEEKLNLLRNHASSINEINQQLEVEVDTDKREELNCEKKQHIEFEDHLTSAIKAEKQLVIQSKVTITALNQKLLELENETTAQLGKEMMNVTEQRKKARNERRKRDSELRNLKADNQEERGTVGITAEKKEGKTPESQHKIDMNSLPSTLWDDFCSLSLEKIYPGQAERIRTRHSPEEVIKKTKTNPFDLRDEDLAKITKNSAPRTRGTEIQSTSKTKCILRSSTPRDHFLSDSDDTDEFWERDRSATPKRTVKTRDPPTEDENDIPRGRRGRKEDMNRTTGTNQDEEPSFREFAKLMGDNLIALRKIQERPPRWGGHRVRTFKGDPKENFDDFAKN